MRVVPRNQLKKILWCKGRVGPWTEHAEAIGTTEADAAAFAAKVEAARAALFTARQARNAARSATLSLHNAIAEMDAAGAGIVKQVRARAGLTKDPGVYALASLPAPAKPSPVGAPGKPTNFGVELFQDGSLELKWSCKNPPGCRGVVYEVWRRVASEGGALTYLGTIGRKRFHDTRVPAGAAMLIYQVRAIRSTAVGPWSTYNVNFGAPAPAPGSPGSVEATARMAA